MEKGTGRKPLDVVHHGVRTRLTLAVRIRVNHQILVFLKHCHGPFPASFAEHIGFGTVISVSRAHGFARGRVLRQTPTDAVPRSDHNLSCHVFYVVQSSGAHLLSVAYRMDLSFIRSPRGCVFFGRPKSVFLTASWKPRSH
mgnify:CR=1 FL=1